MKIFNIEIKELNNYSENQVQHPIFYVASTSTMDAEKRVEKALPPVESGLTRVFRTTVREETDNPGLFVQMYSYDHEALKEADFSFSEFDTNETDQTIDDFRFIKESEINEIMLEELSSDEYLLGCFNDFFIADIFDIPIDAIKAIQEKEAYEALGKMMLASPQKMREMQREYASLDGYGHHFASYDGETHECQINGENWYFFRG